MNESSDAASNEDSIYKSLSTDVLKEMLRYSAFSDETLDLDATRMILDELNDREQGQPHKTPEEAWAVFLSEYSGNESAFADCAFNEEDQIGARPGSERRRPRSIVDGEHRVPRRSSTFKRFGITAAAIVVLALIVFAPIAQGGSIWSSIAQWTQEIFRFTTQEPQQDAELTELNKELFDRDIKERLAPTWLPEGFVLTELTYSPTPQMEVFHALYENGDQALTVQIKMLFIQSVTDYEKDDGLVEIYERNGVKHYIMTNIDQVVAVWSYENYECYIGGDVTKDEVMLMINSIYER